MENDKLYSKILTADETMEYVDETYTQWALYIFVS